MSDEWKAPGSQNADEGINSREEAKSWKLLEKTLLASVQEQRRARRWGIFFKLLTFVFLFVAVVLPMLDFEGGTSRRASHTALIDVQGVIADKESASAENIVTALRDAFEDEKTKGVILRINSPGGSPVQSGYVYDEIRRLRAEKPDIKVYAVITDLGASGAYYIASAADQIYADKASLVGSIGVTAAGFGFVGAMEKLGVDRRTYTSGEHKAFLDPFQPQKTDETQFWQSVLDTTHRQFIASVKQGRGDRLKDKDHPELFSGLIWTGEQAVGLGLVDGLGSASYVARDVIKEKNIVEYTVEESPFDRFSKKLGASIAERIAMLVGFNGPVLR
ncbi:signal peptide peptidase SppA [Pseudomonas cannabina]|uniref:Peptidase S49, SppA n=3 Tax=Pseudomonas syringae group TaxID=136849 RepID=A0A3M3QHB9_PSECA|nr:MULTISPECIES: signal peptide peptidase SppA [Pseudomonas syringae group]KPB70623.1 Peptidase S49 [Pseudomonas syringae pv. maculicola]KPW25808.1 Peptidase S49, SppA [Pseudomonas cannabina pv. alisalensis]MBM0141206.1 signal peptide peptidase SppA [Pseudomonas cannabina pv. alisalensis]QHE98068.1 signal peptide peptidase SppA [Pseudomonas syringae pv. maculicola str. ES4326]QQN23726.1 signal peptide peptidase SppA [Pseudomonas cannabina pv. alisalensis]